MLNVGRNLTHVSGLMSHVLAKANISYQTIVKAFRACNILCSLISNFLKKSRPNRLSSIITKTITANYSKTDYIFRLIIIIIIIKFIADKGP